MKSKSAGKVRLTSFDDLFGTGEAAAGETVTSVPLSQLHTFKDHPFRVLDDEKMQETVESVKRYGVLMPGIVRPHPKGGYEVIAGHRRCGFCTLRHDAAKFREKILTRKEVHIGQSCRVAGLD